MRNTPYVENPARVTDECLSNTTVLKRPRTSGYGLVWVRGFDNKTPVQLLIIKNSNVITRRPEKDKLSKEKFVKVVTCPQRNLMFRTNIEQRTNLTLNVFGLLKIISCKGLKNSNIGEICGTTTRKPLLIKRA